jgi:hypothetical protein
MENELPLHWYYEVNNIAIVNQSVNTPNFNAVVQTYLGECKQPYKYLENFIDVYLIRALIFFVLGQKKRS